MEIDIDKDGSILSSFSIAEWISYARSFVEEKAYLNTQSIPSPSKEARWLTHLLSKIERGSAVAVVAHEGGEIVGLATVFQRPFPHISYASFGIAVRKGWRGRGIGTSLARFAISEAFSSLPISHIMLEVVEDNRKAVELYKALGFEKVALLPNYYHHYGRSLNAILMVLPKDKWVGNEATHP